MSHSPTRSVYFDYAATTPVSSAAFEVLRAFSTESFANPASQHRDGQRASETITDARKFFADYFGTSGSQIVFTSGGTEANNFALYGTALAALAAGSTKKRILVSAIEHPAVRDCARSLSELGFDVQSIPVDRNGQIKRESFQKLLTAETLIVSIMRVNNVMGAINDVEAIAREAKSRFPDLIFHSDAVQAFGKVSVPRSPSSVDLLSLSAHKIHGPKGIGALVVLNPTLVQEGRLRPLLWGGGQEAGLRSGTQSPGLIGAFAEAAREVTRRLQENFDIVASFRKHLEQSLVSRGVADAVQYNSPPSASPYVCNLTLRGHTGAEVVRELSNTGICVSAGSACCSTKKEPDPVLTAMGLPPARTLHGVRISLAPEVTLDELEQLADALTAVVSSARLKTDGPQHYSSPVVPPISLGL